MPTCILSPHFLSPTCPRLKQRLTLQVTNLPVKNIFQVWGGLRKTNHLGLSDASLIFVSLFLSNTYLLCNYNNVRVLSLWVEQPTQNVFSRHCWYFQSWNFEFTAHFEGSLGRLTTASVHNPRQIIDVARGSSPLEDTSKKNVSKELRKFRQLLMDIEKVSSFSCFAFVVFMGLLVTISWYI